MIDISEMTLQEVQAEYGPGNCRGAGAEYCPCNECSTCGVCNASHPICVPCNVHLALHDSGWVPQWYNEHVIAYKGQPAPGRPTNLDLWI